MRETFHKHSHWKHSEKLQQPSGWAAVWEGAQLGGEILSGQKGLPAVRWEEGELNSQIHSVESCLETLLLSSSVPI